MRVVQLVVLSVGMLLGVTGEVAAGAPSTISGRVYDAALGPQSAVAGAFVAYEIAGTAPGASTLTAADGSYAVTFLVRDDDWVSVQVAKDGYLTYSRAMNGSELKQGPVDIALEAAEPRVATSFGGVVFDASVGRSAPLAGATVRYTYHARLEAYPDLEGSAVTDGSGQYGFELLLGPLDWLDMRVSAAGFVTDQRYNGTDGALPLATDFPLAPESGEIQLDPIDHHSNCADQFDVRIANRSADEALTVLRIDFHFHYGGGVYGQDHRWDLTGIDFPLTLAPGADVVFPVTYPGRGNYPSRLEISVVSGARNGFVGAGYYGNCLAACAGDCDGGRRVTIDELILGIGIALGDSAVASCAAFDLDDDGAVAIAELIAAVDRALGSCPF
jgi:hypothetical protein